MFSEVSSVPGNVPAALPSTSRIWWNALFRPSLKTYQDLANDPRASSQQAYRWVVRSGLVAGLVLALLQSAGNLGGICLGPIFAALLGLVGLVFVAGVSHGVAKVLGGAGTYARLAYATAAYTVPLMLITAVVGVVATASVPAFSALNMALSVYGLVLNTLAVKAVHQLSWGRAALPSVVLAGLWLMLFIGVVILVVVVAG
jgi:hypothetical protein